VESLHGTLKPEGFSSTPTTREVRLKKPYGRYHGNLGPEGFTTTPTTRGGINGSIPGTGVRVIKLGTLRGGYSSPGVNGITPGPEGLTSTPTTVGNHLSYWQLTRVRWGGLLGEGRHSTLEHDTTDVVMTNHSPAIGQGRVATRASRRRNHCFFDLVVQSSTAWDQAVHVNGLFFICFEILHDDDDRGFEFDNTPRARP